jgi:hypothetical protein
MSFLSTPTPQHWGGWGYPLFGYGLARLYST